MNNPQSKIQNPKSSGDDGSPSMLEELMRGTPGSFVAAHSNADTSIHGVTARATKVRQGATGRPLERPGNSSGCGIDGGFIMGPGLDGEHEVVAEVAGNVGSGMWEVGSGELIRPEPAQPEQPDHRKYDAQLKAEAEKQAAAKVITDLLGLRDTLVGAAWQLRTSGADELGGNAILAAGFIRIDRVTPDCALCGRPRCKHRREVIEAVIRTADDKVIILTVEV